MWHYATTGNDTIYPNIIFIQIIKYTTIGYVMKQYVATIQTSYERYLNISSKIVLGNENMLIKTLNFTAK